MLFSRFASYVAGFVTVGILATASASPVAEPAIEKRGGEQGSLIDVSNILNDLEINVNVILPKIDALNPTTLTDVTVVAPIVAELTAAIDSATKSITAAGANGGLKKDGSSDDVAKKLAEIIKVVSEHCEPFYGNPKFILFSGLLAKIDLALKGLLFEVSLLVDGILILVAKLLVDVVVILKELGFVLTCALLAL